jgi:hypothetical protein
MPAIGKALYYKKEGMLLMIKLTTKYLFLILLPALVLQACVAGQRLATSPADPADLKGTYTLLLYGCHYPEDIKNLAILVDEESKYPVEIYDLPTSYQVKKGVPGPQALKEADSFVRCSIRQVSGTQLGRIADGTGGTIGYEVRPLYNPLEFGSMDVLLVSYSLQNGTVRTYVRLHPNVERMLESPGKEPQHSFRQH